MSDRRSNLLRESRKKKPTIATMTVLYKKVGFKRPKAQARQYMRGFNDAKKYK